MDIALGLLLVAIGAILAFAVRMEPSGLDLDAVGWILMVSGIIIVILSLAWWGRRRFTRVVEHRTYPPPMVEHRLYPPMVGKVVEREVYLPEPDRYVERGTVRYPEERIVEREVPPPARRITEREIYEDPPPPP